MPAMVRTGSLIWMVVMGSLCAASCGDDPVHRASDGVGGEESGAGGGGSLSAGGGSEAPEGGKASGGLAAGGAATGETRLREQVHAAPGGAEEHVALYDTELDSVCSFVQTGVEHGEPVFHCLKAAAVQVAYLDDQCQNAVGVLTTGCGASAAQPGDVVIGTQSAGPGCAAETSVFTVGAAATATELYTGLGGGCDLAPYYLDEDLVELTPLEDFSDYVRGTLAVEELDPSTGLELVTVEGEDGGSTFYEYRQAGKPCLDISNDRDSRRCLPQGYATTDQFGVYADDQCENELALRAASVCTKPADSLIIHSELVNGCYRPAQAFELGAALAPDQVFKDQSCTAGPVQNGFEYFELGAEVSIDQVPLLSLVKQGDGRLQALRWSSVVGGTVSGDEFYDNELDGRCFVRLGHDGKLRCMLEGPFTQVGFYYSDDQCTEPVTWLFSGGCNPVFQDGDLDYDVDFEACPLAVSAAYELVSYDGPLYTNTDGCSPVEPGTITDRVFVVRGDEVPLTRFAEVELTLK